MENHTYTWPGTLSDTLPKHIRFFVQQPVRCRQAGIHSSFHYYSRFQHLLKTQYPMVALPATAHRGIAHYFRQGTPLIYRNYI